MHTQRSWAIDFRREWQWILRHVAPYKGYAIIYVAGALLWQLASSAVPWVTGKSVDIIVSNPSNGSAFISSVLLLLVIVITRGIVGIGTTYALENIGNGVERDTRNEIYRSVVLQQLNSFDTWKIGDVMARSANDTRQINALFQPGVEFLFIAVYGTIVPLLFIIGVRLELLLVPLLFLCAFFVLVPRYSRTLSPLSDQLQSKFGEFSSHLTEVITGIELVESTSQKMKEQERLEALAQQHRSISIEHGRAQARYLPSLLLNMALAGALVHGLILVGRGQLAIGELVAYLGFVGLLRQPVEALGTSLVLVRLGLAGARRVLELVDSDTSSAPQNGDFVADSQGHIVVRNVGFCIGASRILSEVSLTVDPGSVVAIVGATGSGKSTLGKLLNRTFEPTTGEILLDGINIRNWNLEALRKNIAIVEQDVVLFSRTISDNITFGDEKDKDTQRLVEVAKVAQAHEFILTCEDQFSTLVGERGTTLSGGQRQRIAIARALFTNPSILILDDATSAIDSVTEEKILSGLRRAYPTQTVILITSRLVQTKWADTIVLLDRGQVVAHGSHEQLLQQSPLYKRMASIYR